MNTQSILPAAWDVPQVLRDRLGSRVGRQRAMQAEGHLLLVVHLPPKPDEDERQGRFLWRKPDGTWNSSDLGSGLHVVGKHLDQYAEVVDRFDNQEESASSADDYFAVLDGLSPVHRAARHLHQVLQEARKMLPDDRDIINFRDRAYDLERMAELTYNGAKNAMEFAVARQAESQARTSNQMAVSSHRLNLLAAFFFPLATLSSVFGVNLRHGLENMESTVPFLLLLGIGLLAGIVLTGFVMSRR